MRGGEQLVKLEKLVKTLRRDLAANPMKSGVLGVLLLGGLYFWGPLIWKWVGKKGSAASASVVVNSPSVAELTGGQSAGVQAVRGATSPIEAKVQWQEVRNLRERDPLTQSAHFSPEWGHVFQVATAAAKDGTPQTIGEETKKVEVGPQQLGLVLQGVTVGSKTKKAIINGVVYRELDWITAKQVEGNSENKDDHHSEFKFQMVKVHRRMVELAGGGKIWTLKLAAAELEERKPAKGHPAEQLQAEPREEKGSLSVTKQTIHEKE